MENGNGNDHAVPLCELTAALAKAQAAFPVVPKSREVTVRTQGGQSYSFVYAPLDTILSATRAPLCANGLALTQLLVGTELITRLMHTSGGMLESRLAIPQGGRMQELGSAITYLRRYSVQGMLGIAAEDDDDANAADGNQRAIADRGAPTPKPEEMMPRAKAPPAEKPKVEPRPEPEATAGMVKFILNGTEYTTRGATREQMLTTFDLVPKMDKKHGKNAAATLLLKEFSVATRSDLDAEQADKFIVRLREHVDA